MYQVIYDPRCSERGYFWTVLTCTGQAWFATHNEACLWLYQHGQAH